jgi:hypothetical protein
MLELFIFTLIVVFLFFGGLEAVFAFIQVIFQGILWLAYAIPVIVGALALYGMYWIAFIS